VTEPRPWARWAGLLVVLLALTFVFVRSDACSSRREAARSSETTSARGQGRSVWRGVIEQAISPHPVDAATRRASTSAATDWDRLSPDRREALAAEAVAAAVADPQLRAWAERRLSATRADYFRTAEGGRRYLALERALAEGVEPRGATRP
jgi:hypothetical protein